jgi:hypothetical protein
MFVETTALAHAPKSFDVALKIANALLESRDDVVACGILFDSLAPPEQQRIPSHVRDYAARIRRRAVRRVVHPRLEQLLAQYERQFGCQTTGNCPPATEEDTTKEQVEASVEEESIADVLSSQRVSRLQTNADFERWVTAVVRLEIDYDRFDAALGTSSNDPTDPARERRLEQLREHARWLYRNMTGGK